MTPDTEHGPVPPESFSTNTGLLPEHAYAGHVRDLLESVVQRSLQRNGAPQAREAVRRACKSARERGIRAEQLLIMLKEAWNDAPEVRRRARPFSDDALGELVTCCIEEYYALPDGR